MSSYQGLDPEKEERNGKIIIRVLFAFGVIAFFFLMRYVDEHEGTIDDGINDSLLVLSHRPNIEFSGRVTSCKIHKEAVGIRINTRPEELVLDVAKNPNYDYEYQVPSRCIHSGDSIYKSSESDSIYLITDEKHLAWKVNYR